MAEAAQIRITADRRVGDTLGRVDVTLAQVDALRADLKPTLENAASITAHANEASAILFRRDALPAQLLGLTGAAKVTLGQTAETMTHCYSRLQFRGVVECFVVLFQPAGLHRLFSIPMQELTDRALDARSVLGAFASRFEQMIADCRTFSERVRLADSYLLHRALEAHHSDRISAAAAQFLSASGKARVGDVAAESGLSVRQFERGFMQQLGVSPKLFARIVRFEAALDRKARSSAKSWTEIANDLGYFDQMHMIHDFKVFTGGTPTLALAEIETLFHERLAAIQAGPSPAAADPDLDLII